ncbi:ATP-binding cassette domain-containing protein [Paenibacillus glucanolyticus]|uniref:ATP-binding cassette domain-containing protein n=1 Tax=Paenibacillus glucanolyticus TaxID=59843 RepID=UPI00096F7167|nr:ATP-binding cassette domain-containing protein [Paenibacillus glucanolyticus]MPY16756.1 ATP-binding cassette domain-containing protein [Paenibacillus glucanolyticus]OMF71373.1 daunorubicin/doxorubicin resistance ABC transporter ATP-binding protein DrrA [Paenibacillus glucanolyticus]
MPYAIEAKKLRKSYNGIEVVQGIDLRLGQGELLALLGPNGAGKTTTIHMLSTLLKPDAGSAQVAGLDIVKDARNVRKKISLTGQFAALDEGLSGLQNLMLISRLYGYSAKAARSISEELMESFGLGEAKDRTVQQYSGGMRRRLDIAASIVTKPDVIFLDEPTTGLDPQSRMQVWDIVKTLLQQGTTVLLTTQYLEEADRLADRIAVIDKGRIIAEGTPQQLKASIGGRTLSIRLTEQGDWHKISALLNDEHGLRVWQGDHLRLYKIPVLEASLANQAIHTLMENGIAIEDFSLSEPSLDEVFLALTRKGGTP